MSNFDDFMIEEAVEKNQEIQRLLTINAELLRALDNSLVFIDYLCEISTLRNQSVRMMAGYQNIQSAIKQGRS